MPKAAIDIGSNSILLMVVDDAGRVLHDEINIVGLGRGLGDRGIFRGDRMDAAMEVLMRCAERARDLGVPPWDIRAAATSAARRALNARAFFERVQASSGIQVQVISGPEEARLTWLGALGSIELPPGPVAVVDLGGGSTEVVLGEGDRVGVRTSLEIGAVRLTEQFFTGPRHRPQELARLRAHVTATFGTLELPITPRTVVGVAGTATTLAAMEQGLTSWDRTRVHGSRLTRGALRRWIDRLLEATPEERTRLSQVAPERAPYLLAGAVVLEAACTALHRDSMRISDGGVRSGLLVDPVALD